MFIKNKEYLFIFFTHFVFSLFLFFFLNFEYAENWNFFWQNINEKHLLFSNNGLKNIWLMHSQPPLHNFYYAIILNLFYPNQQIAYKIIQAIIGALLVTNFFFIINYLIKLKLFKIILKLMIFFNPAIFLYEHYYLYTLNTGFLISLMFVLLILFIEKKQNKYFLLFIFVVNILILYRSTFHLIFLIIVFLYSIYIFKISKKTLIISILISFISVGWYLKNYFYYNFFGSSSWLGLNLYKFITTNFTKAKANKVKEKIFIPEFFLYTNHFYTELNTYRKFGFNKNSKYEFLNENNWHNINVIEISKAHKELAIKIIKNFPIYYISNVIEAYKIFSMPSFTYPHLENNKKKFSFFVNCYNNIFYFDNFFIKKFINQNIYFFNLFIFPIIIIIYLMRYFKKQFTQNKEIILFLIITIIYYSIINFLLEVGENNRFRFGIEMIIIIIIFNFLENCKNNKNFNI